MSNSYNVPDLIDFDNIGSKFFKDRSYIDHLFFNKFDKHAGTSVTEPNSFINNNSHGILLNTFDVDRSPQLMLEIVDEKNIYKINSFGYRGNEIDPGAKVLFSGCSQSFGMGIPEEMIWGIQLSERLNLSYNNISMYGWSPMRIILNIFAYFKEYGHPEYLFVLFPDFLRLTLPSNNKDLISQRVMNAKASWQAGEKMVHNSYFSNIYLPAVRTDKDYISKPYVYEDVLSHDVAYFLNIQYLLILEQYCANVGIKFLWSTWIKELEAATVNFQKHSDGLFYNNFVNCHMNKWYINAKNLTCYYMPNYYDGMMDALPCHEDYRSLYPHAFDLGSDDHFGDNRRHIGVHQHIHIAQLFFERLQNDNIRD